MYFGGPEIAWQQYSEQVLRHGLSPRIETAVSGRSLYGLDGALRTFEIHETQVGCIVCVADAIASVFVVPHPDDYRRLHRSLLMDFYGELMWHYSALYDRVWNTGPRIDERPVMSLSHIVSRVEQMRREWRDHHALIASPLLQAPLQTEQKSKLGGFRLLRFCTALRLDEANHIGEAIVRESDGAIEYLKTFRLSDKQTRRAYLLQHLAAHRWNLRAAAAANNDTYELFIRRIERAGFGYMLKEHVLQAARRRRR